MRILLTGVRRWIPPAAGLSAALLGSGCSGRDRAGGEGPAGRPPPPVPVVFEGNRALPSAELERTVADDLARYAEDPRPSVLDDAAFRLNRRYRTDGYAFVEVAPGVADGRVRFRIREGPKVSPGRLRFEGNRAFSERELREALPGNLPGRNPPWTYRLVAAQTESILARYRSRGYLDAVVHEPVQDFDSRTDRMNVTLRITEGEPYALATIEGLPEGFPGKILEPFRDRPYTPDTPAEVESAVIDHYRDAGRPFARAEAVPTVDREARRVTLAVRADPGSAARIGELRIGEGHRTRPGFVRHRADLSPGAAYRASDLRRAEDRLRETGLYRSVRVAPGAYDPETGLVATDIDLQPRDAGEVALRGGYSTFDGPRLGGDVGHRNLFGGGEMVRIGATVSRFSRRGELETAVPYLFGTEFRLGNTVYYEEQRFRSFDATSYGTVPALSYPIRKDLTATVGARIATIRTDDVEEDIPPGDRLDFRYTALFGSAVWDRRDSALLPTRGFVVHGLAESSFDPLNSDIRFVRGSGRATGYVPLGHGLVVAASLAGGVIAPMQGTGEIPIALRYFAGGTNTVRGFRYGTIGPQIGNDPTGGELFLAAQLELRYPIAGDLHGAVFADRGGVWFHRDDFDPDETRYGIGTGLRYHTPAGAVVADVAWNPSRREGERSVEFHLSIGFPF